MICFKYLKDYTKIPILHYKLCLPCIFSVIFGHDSNEIQPVSIEV